VSQDNILHSNYLTRPVVRKRNSVTLTTWSGYVSALAIPATPDDAWVRQRVLAEQIPLQLEYQITQTLVYFLQDTDTQTNILQFISEDNDTPTEVALASQNDSVIAAFAPRYANTVITDDQVDKWRDQNNAPAPGKEKP
jgi:hypothetical protein